MARAAELSNQSIPEFTNILKKLDVPWCEYTDKMKEEDDLAINYFLHEIAASYGTA